MRYPRARYCVRLPQTLIAVLRKQGSPNHQIGELIDSFDWSLLRFALETDFGGVELEQITVQTSIAGKADLVDYCLFSGRQQRLVIAQAIASIELAKSSTDSRGIINV